MQKPTAATQEPASPQSPKTAGPQDGRRSVPASPTEWYIQAEAVRKPDGGVVVTGTTNMPDGLKLWIELANGATSEVFVTNGSFASSPFTNRGKALPVGKQRVTFTAHFNQSWQKPQILAITGKDGSRLSGKLFRATEPDVIDSPKALEYSVQLAFPPASSEARAIEFVKAAVLVVPGRGKSSANVGDTVDWFMKPGTGMAIGKGWSARQVGPDQYAVRLDYEPARDGPAIWSANLRTRQVRYVNMNAKYMSYLPPD